MSRLRSIFVEANAAVLKGAMEDVLFLCTASNAVRAKLLHKTKLKAVKDEPNAARDQLTPEIPDLFLAVAQQASRSKNAHYQQVVIVEYMLLDSELFGRFMLQNEPEALQELFMKALKEMNTFFITGHRLDGTPFKPGDNLNQRRTGPFITRIREMFALL
jgi:hypothetical protein